MSVKWDYADKGKYLVLEEHRVDGVLLGVVRVDKSVFQLMKTDVLKVKGQMGYDKYLVVLKDANLITVSEMLAADALNKGV